MEAFAIINAPVAPVYASCEKTCVNGDGLLLSTVSDEAVYGAVCRVLGEEGGMLRILSHYGYAGYIDRTAVLPVPEGEAEAWLSSGLMVVTAGSLDVMSAPKVQAVVLTTLPGGAVLGTFPEEPAVNGWRKVKLADGTAGYVTAVHLADKLYREDYLRVAPETVLRYLERAELRSRDARGGWDGFSFRELLARHFGGSEAAFRESLVRTALRYLNVQYRWSGRSTYGVDCSGLVSVCYMLNGVNIYRDAAIVEGYPMEKLVIDCGGEDEIPAESIQKIRKGDALYFPGHIAMYLGEGRYIHSTGRAGDNGVVINSLLPGDPDYRDDLPRSLYAVGGLRADGGRL